MKYWLPALGAALIVTALVWFALHGRMEPEPDLLETSAAARPTFHASRPLNVDVRVEGETDSSLDADALGRELRYILYRGRMRVAPALADDADLFTLRVEVRESAAKLALVAPDGQAEREQQVDLSGSESRLETIRRLVHELPALLGATHNKVDWRDFVGTQDAAAYDRYLRSTSELFGRSAQGFTRASAVRAQSVERLEALTKRQPGFARAWSALALSYLSLGGEDRASLVELAESSAERALSLEPEIANAQAALGLVRLHRNEWALAKEHFDRALAADPNSSAALEGLACLLVDVGQHRAALPLANRAVALQPRNAGAQECLTYAQLALGSMPDAEPGSQAFAAARVRALIALLSRDVGSARKLLRNSQDAPSASWVEPLLRAVDNRRAVPSALQEITSAANESEIDAVTEILSGAALREGDFVFNRMLRLHRKNDAVPLRLLWLDQTAFLREHPQFKALLDATAVPTYWKAEGPPDLCAKELTTRTRAEATASWCP
jgi:tetratricopeptide (TPR) repeat protein